MYLETKGFIETLLKKHCPFQAKRFLFDLINAV